MKSEIIIHHSASHDGRGFDVGDIKTYHVKDRGYIDIGYHAIVDKVGDDYYAVFGRRWWLNGAHCRGRNDKALGLCFIGNYNLGAPPEEMLVKGYEVVRTWMWLFNIPPRSIYPHSELAATDCPGTLFPWEKFHRLCGGTP